MDIDSILEMLSQHDDPGAIADAIIDYLDAHWSSHDCAQRAALISTAERFHEQAVEHLLG